MDFTDPGPLLSGAVISMIGLGIFMYGKKTPEVKSIGIGLAMMLFPMFVHSILWMWLIAVVCLAGQYLLPRCA